MTTRRFKKYSVNKNSRFFATIFLIFFFVLYIVSEIFLKTQIEDVFIQLQSIKENKLFLNVFGMIKDISIVVFSILFTAILSTYLIEIHDKNEAFNNHIDDCITLPQLYGNLNEESKNVLFSAFESKNNENYKAIFDDIRCNIYKILNVDTYFIEKSDMVIECSIENNKIKKEITRYNKYRSYRNEKLILIDEEIIRYTSIKDCECTKKRPKIKDCLNCKQYFLQNVSITNKRGDYIIYDPYEENTKEALDIKNNYNKKAIIKLPEFIIDKDEGAEIYIKYTTYTPISDNRYAFRLLHNCKNFSFNFHMNSNEYQLMPYAFGFCDNGNVAPNNNDVKSVHFEFDHWSFEHDGVVIFMQKTDTTT